MQIIFYFEIFYHFTEREKNIWRTDASLCVCRHVPCGSKSHVSIWFVWLVYFAVHNRNETIWIECEFFLSALKKDANYWLCVYCIPFIIYWILNINLSAKLIFLSSIWNFSQLYQPLIAISDNFLFSAAFKMSICG